MAESNWNKDLGIVKVQLNEIPAYLIHYHIIIGLGATQSKWKVNGMGTSHTHM